MRLAYEYGLVNGKTATTFAPDSNLTVAEAIKMAAVLHSIYTTGTSTLQNSTPWYQAYVDYALRNGIISTPFNNYNANATRADFAVIFAGALPAEALTPINQIGVNTIPDVSVSYSYGPAVYLLYRAGILTGSGETRAFMPNDTIKRSEVAAIAARMVNTDKRVTFSISTKDLTATEIAAKCSPAVFYIELYNSKGKITSSGSGFFISDSGLAVTNYHVIEGTYSGKIVLETGKVCNIAGVYDYSVKNDLALLQIEGSGFPHLELGDAKSLKEGDEIHAIGYPGGIDQAVSQGTVTNSSHMSEGVECILIDAAITPGSSGGPLINAEGQAVGVTTAYYVGAQNMNIVVPINLVDELNRTEYKTMSAIYNATKPTLTLTPGNIQIIENTKATLKVSVSSLSFENIVYSFSVPDIVSCQWSQVASKEFLVTLNGLSNGNTMMTVNLLDADSKVLASEFILIKIDDLRCYTSCDGVPNFGVYLNVIPSDQYADKHNHGYHYLYNTADLTISKEEAIKVYTDLLDVLGFKNGNRDINDKITYSNNDYLIIIGIENKGSYSYIHVQVFFRA